MNKSPSKKISVKELSGTMMEKVKAVLQMMKEKGHKLTPKLKKWATSALAGSLVAGMLFMAGCDEMKSMEQIYPKEVVEMLEDNGFSSKDYDSKKEEFLNTDPGDLDCGLDIVPHDYYKEKFGLTDQEIRDWVVLGNIYFADGDMYLVAFYSPTIEKLQQDQMKAKVAEISALFRVSLDETTYQALIDASNSKDVISSTKAMDETKYFEETLDIWEETRSPKRVDKINNYAFRVLLHNVLNSKKCKLLGEAVNYGTSDTDKLYKLIGDGDKMTPAYYSYDKDGYLNAYYFKAGETKRVGNTVEMDYKINLACIKVDQPNWNTVYGIPIYVGDYLGDYLFEHGSKDDIEKYCMAETESSIRQNCLATRDLAVYIRMINNNRAEKGINNIQ